MKNEVFNGSRFWNWFKYDTIQLWRNHMFAALGIGLAGLISYIVTVCFNLIVHGQWQGIGNDGRLFILIFACIALELYQTSTYGYLTKKQKGSAWLMAPASKLEKWTSMLINTLIVIPVLFLVVFLGVDWLLCLVDHTCGTSIISMVAGGYGKLSAEIAAGSINITMGAIWWFLIACACLNFLYFLLCGIVFKKHKVIWGIAVAMVASSIFAFIAGTSGDNSNLNIMVNNDNARAAMDWFSAGSTAIALCLATAIYYRIKTIKH